MRFVTLLNSFDYNNTSKRMPQALKAYVATAQTGKASLDGFKTSMAGAATAQKSFSLATAAATLGQIAFNTAISFGVSFAISALIAGISKLANAQKELAQNANDSVLKWGEQEASLREQQSLISDVGSRYIELSKGVSDNGKNISLSAQDYAEYNTIAGQIAEKFPSLVSGYTEQGNAILKCRDNLNALTDAYQTNAQAANDAVRTDSAAVFENFKNQTGEGFDSIRGYNTSLTYEQKIIGDLIAEAKSGEAEFRKYYDDLLRGFGNINYNDTAMRNALKNAGIKRSSFADNAGNIYKDLPKLEARYRQLTAAINAETEKVKPISEAILKDDEGFHTLSDGVKTGMISLLNGLGTEFYNQFKDDKELGAWIDKKLIKNFDKPEFLAAFENIGKLSENQSIDDYNTQLNESVSILSKLNGLSDIAIRVAFDIEGTEELEAKLQKMVNPNNENLQANFWKDMSIGDAKQMLGMTDEIESLLGGLNLNEGMNSSISKAFTAGDNVAKAAIRQFIDFSKQVGITDKAVVDLWAQLKHGGWENAATTLDDMSEFSSLLKQAGVDQSRTQSLFNQFEDSGMGSSLHTLNDAFSKGGMTTAEYNAGLQKIKASFSDIAKVDSKTLDGIFSALEKGFDTEKLTSALDQAENVFDRFASSSGSERDFWGASLQSAISGLEQLRNEAQAIQDFDAVSRLTKEIDKYKAAMESATSALDKFKASQSAPDYDDQLKSFGSAYETIEKGLKNGKVGGQVFTDAWTALFGDLEIGSKQAEAAMKRLKPLFKEDVAIKDYIKAFEGLESMKTTSDDKKKVTFEVTDLSAFARELGITETAALGLLESLQMFGAFDFSNLIINDVDALKRFTDVFKGLKIEDPVKIEGYIASFKSQKATLEAELKLTGTPPERVKEIQNMLALYDGLIAEAEAKLNVDGGEDLEKATKELDVNSGKQATAELEIKTSGAEESKKAVDDVKSEDGSKSTITTEIKTEGGEALSDALGGVNENPAPVKIGVEIEGGEKIDELASKLDALSNAPVSVKLDIAIDGTEALDETKAKLESFTNPNTSAKINVEVAGSEALGDLRAKLDAFRDEAINIGVTVNTEGADTLKGVRDSVESLNGLSATASVEIDVQGASRIQEVYDALNNIHGKRVTAVVDANTSASEVGLQLATTEANTLQSAIARVSSMRIGDLGLSNVVSAANNAISKLHQLNNIQLTNKTVTITTINKTVNQTENSKPAKAEGGYSQGGKTLVGEEGVELVRSGDRAYLVGKNGPEIVMLQKGDQVFSNPETKQILKGNDDIDKVPAYASGTYSYSGGSGNSKRSNSGSSSSSSRSSRNDDRGGNDIDSDYEEEARRAEEEAERAAEEAKRQWEEMVRGMFRELEHKLRMDVIDEAEYYRQLAALNQQHYAGNAEYRDEYYSNLERLRDWEKEKAQNAFRDLEYQRKMGVLSERQYFFEMAKLNDKYYQQKLIDLDEYRDKRLDILEGLKQDEIDTQEKKRDDYDSAYDAVKRTLEREIERLEAEKDALTDEDVEGSYGQRIKVLQDELELMEKQNDQADRALALSRAREELERAKTQRKNLIYREGVGFVYEGDQNDIREAQDELDDELFEESKRRIEDQIEELEKQAEAEEKIYDERIEQLTEYEEAWADAVESYQVEKDRLIAAQLLGADWEQQILDRRIDTIAKFKDEYNAILAEIRRLQELSLEEYEKTLKPGEGGSDANSGKKPGSGDGASIRCDKNAFLDYVERQKKGVKDWFDQMNKGWYPVTQGKYARGTLDARAGLSVVDDGSGKELIVRKPTQGRYTFLEAGSVVYDAQKTRNLWDWGDFKPSELMEKVKKFAVPPKATIVPKSGDVSIQQGDIVIQGNADSSLIPQIRAEIERANQSLARELFQKSYQKV